MIDIAAGKQTVFRDVPSDYVACPAWSPDSRQLVFVVASANKPTRLGLIGSDGSGFQLVGDQKLFNPAFAIDGKSSYCANSTNIYRIDLAGKALSQWNITDTVPDANGINCIRPAADGKGLLLEVSLNDKKLYVKDLGYFFQSDIFLFDTGTGKAKRISSSKFSVSKPCWFTAEEYLFTGAEDENSGGIYKSALDGGAPTLLKEYGDDVTVSER